MSLYFYILFYILAIVFSHIQLSTKKNILFLNLILVTYFILLISNRSITDSADTSMYLMDFNSLKTNSLYIPSTINTYGRFEYGYTLLSQIIKIIFGDNIKIWFAIVALLDTILIAYASKNIYKWSLKNSENASGLVNKSRFLFAPFFTIFVSFYGFMYCGIVMRQGLAMALILCAFYHFLAKNYKTGIVLYLIALSFHNSAFLSIGVLLVVCFKRSYTKATYTRYMVIITFLYISRLPVYLAGIIQSFLFHQVKSGFFLLNADKVQSYLGNADNDLIGYSFQVLFNFLFAFIAINLMDKKNILQQKLVQLYLIANTIICFLSGIHAMARLADYYSIFDVLLFYLLISNGRLNLKKLLYFLVIVLTNLIIFYRLAIY